MIRKPARALKKFKSGKRPGGQDELEDFLGYRDFTERARRYGKETE